MKKSGLISMCLSTATVYFLEQSPFKYFIPYLLPIYQQISQNVLIFWQKDYSSLKEEIYLQNLCHHSKFNLVQNLRQEASFLFSTTEAANVG